METDIQQKQVKIAELQAEAEAVQKVKEAEGDAQSKVVEAKGEADAMQYTLPLKQKQIEQSKLEAEARKEATIQNAEADAQAKVIDSKAELERRNLLADAEANRIRVMAAANAERMTSEAELLNKSPLLINKIIAERLSDKIQVVMVPSDGKFFFANDVFKGSREPDREAGDGHRAGAGNRTKERPIEPYWPCGAGAECRARPAPTSRNCVSRWPSKETSIGSSRQFSRSRRERRNQPRVKRSGTLGERPV